MREVAWSHDQPGILIRVTGEEDDFQRIAGAALDRIASKPIGRGLLKTIAANCLMYGQKVVIVNKPQQQGSITYAFGLDRAQVASLATKECADGTVVYDLRQVGRGSSSSIVWDHRSEETPDGRRPVFIGLAHEMVHALNNLHGLILGSPNPVIITRATKIDEARTVGLGRFADEPFTENKIRMEHRIAARRTYTGKITGTESYIFNPRTPLPTGADLSMTDG